MMLLEYLDKGVNISKGNLTLLTFKTYILKNSLWPRKSISDIYVTNKKIYLRLSKCLLVENWTNECGYAYTGKFLQLYSICKGKVVEL